jgi:hypothetical protein
LLEHCDKIRCSFIKKVCKIIKYSVEKATMGEALYLEGMEQRLICFLKFRVELNRSALIYDVD